VLEGFTRAYELVLAHRDQMLAADGPLAAFASGSVRVIARPTNQYALLSAVRNAPRYQRDGLMRSVVLDALFRPVNASRDRPREWPILVEERRAIEALDVPRFVVPADGRTVFSAGRAILDDAYQRSPLEAVHDRLRGLSREDCAAQRRSLRRALGESTATRFTTAAPSRDDDFVAHAEWIGRELLAHANESNGHLAWTDGTLDHAAAHHLYDGTLGPALFFSALAATTGDQTWRHTAHSALAPALAWAESTDDGQPMAIGGCSGLGSIVYGLATAGALLDDRRALHAAARVAAWIDADRIAADRHFDVVDGAAGAVLGVLALHASTRDPALLDIARRCARHVIAAHVEAMSGWAWPGDGGRRIVGFAHGAAGIATALLRLSAVVECAAFRDAAVKALASVAGAFAPGDASWPIAVSDADDDIGARTSRMNAWCHGAPGIALAAAAALDIAPEVKILTQARSAVDRIARWDAGQADHLCCGHLGRADVLLTAGVRLAGAGAADVAKGLGARVVERARRQRHFRLSTPGFEYRVVDAGLFRGLSGIGYELLRLAAPERLPSILSFEPVGSGRT
jgi:type 2 lantibiotic biosynthesis protein LanM